MNYQSSNRVDQSLSGWMDAYGRLKAAQTTVKAAGTKSTLLMRQDVDRLRRCAESALKKLQSQFDASRSKSAQPPHASSRQAMAE